MYEQYFDDVPAYTSKEVLRRAYALGVISVCDDPNDAAYEQLKRKSPDTYDETIIELAYDEGRANALDLKAKQRDSETIWEQLVESEFESAHPEQRRPARDVPEFLRANETQLSEGPPDRLSLPSFLRR